MIEGTQVMQEEVTETSGKMKSQTKPVFGYKICPFCGGNVEYAGISSGHIFPAINTGQMYVCRECGYQGGFIIEVDDLDDARKIREELKINSDGIKTPGYKLSEKWVWLWKIWLAIMVLIFLSEIIVLIPRIIEHG